MAENFAAKGCQNLELEHLMVFSACVRVQQSSKGLDDAWCNLYDGLKDWVLVALCDPVCCGLAAATIEVRTSRSLSLSRSLS